MISTLKTTPGKLHFLAKLKNTHVFEPYLNINNFEHRRAITKIRTSSHKLEIETGRWNKMQRENRICKNCALGEIEDELHLLFNCRMHETERRKLFEVLKHKMNVDLSLIPTIEERIISIFSSNDLSTLNALGTFIKNALSKRENVTCYVLPPHYVYYQDTGHHKQEVVRDWNDSL